MEKSLLNRAQTTSNLQPSQRLSPHIHHQNFVESSITMASPSPPRGRSRTRSRSASPHSRSPSRSLSPVRPRSRTRSRTPSDHNGRDHRNGARGRRGTSASRSRSRSRSPSRERDRGPRSYRERSYSRTMDRGSPPPKKTAKVRYIVLNGDRLGFDVPGPELTFTVLDRRGEINQERHRSPSSRDIRRIWSHRNPRPAHEQAM
jgi:hypothetical protein